MKNAPVTCSLTIAALALATGCGSSGDSGSTSTAAPATSAAAPAASTTKTAAATAPQPEIPMKALRGLVLATGDLPGYRRDGSVKTYSSPAWAKYASEDPARLRAAGFVRALRVDLINRDKIYGISLIERFKKPAAAQAEVRRNLTTSPTPSGHFAVPGIPGAIGFGSSQGLNVAFSKGSTYFVIGTQTGTTAANDKQLVAAAKAQYAAAT